MMVSMTMMLLNLTRNENVVHQGGSHLQWQTHVSCRPGGDLGQRGKDETFHPGRISHKGLLAKTLVTYFQVKWGPVYTLYSDYNVVILYDGTFVEVNPCNQSHHHHHHHHHHPNHDMQVIPAPWVKGQHCGICGNFDGNTKNEMEDKVKMMFSKKITMIDVKDIYDIISHSDGGRGACRYAVKGLVPTVKFFCENLRLKNAKLLVFVLEINSLFTTWNLAALQMCLQGPYIGQPSKDEF